jgi:phage gpG-like protein
MKSVFGFRETQRALQMIQCKLVERSKKAMQDAVLIIERAAKENIVHGRTDWPALSPATLARRKDNRPLYDKGTLLRGIHSEADEMQGVVGSGEEYAPTHELGTKTAGRTRNITVPARSYLEPACREHMREIKEVYVRRLRGH